MEYRREEGRIAAYEDGREVGEVTWTSGGEGSIIIDHTFVDNSQRGKGIAGELVRQAVEMAQGENLTVIPLCPYAKREFARHPEYQSVQAGTM